MSTSTGKKGILGVPASSIALLAAVTAAFQLIPFSVVLGPGTSFPLSLAIHSLIGVLLGPAAGGLTVLIGSTIGIMIAPHTAFLGPFTVLVVALGAVVGGLIASGRAHIAGFYLIGAGCLWIVLYYALLGAPQNLIVLFYPWRYFLPGVLLLIPQLNKKVILMLQSEKRWQLAVAYCYVAWISSQADHTVSSILGNEILYQLPEEVWTALMIAIVGAERGVLALVATVIGTGVILGLRNMGTKIYGIKTQ